MNTAKAIDNVLFTVLKISAVLVAVMIGVSFFTPLNPVWVGSLLALTLFICTVLMLLKGALTGKRYAQGAKNRRARLLPMLFKNNESLEDDMIKIWKEAK